ncbi:MAG: carboxypeptidase-like regulatory domain-containing protein [Cyclobacteriaceae bacterium]
MKFYFLFFFYLVTHLIAMAEDFHAVVLDAETGEPLPFSTITIEGTYSGTVSNAEGFFILDVGSLKGDQTIVITHLGYEPLKITVQKLYSMEEVRLKPS